MTESSLKIKVRKEIRKQYPDAWIWKIHDSCSSGIPDFLIIIKGVHIFIELKIKKGVVKPIQEYTISAIKRAGGNAFICRSAEEVMEAICITIQKHSTI